MITKLLWAIMQHVGVIPS